MAMAQIKVDKTQKKLSADDLRRMSMDEIMEVFLAGTAPETLEPIEGDPCGHGIALKIGAGGWLDRWLRKHSCRDSFPWHGKSFRMKTPTEGWGFNRLARGPVVTVFPFKTSIGPSVLDGQPSVILDYDIPRNPWWERVCWDELREVGPGVYLGVTTVRWRGRNPVVFWFAVDTTTPKDWSPAA